jgi:O-antigen/teichoic acid export membrane protein
MDRSENRTARLLTSGSILARNTFWNLLGQGAPLVVAVISIPYLVSGLGLERFGFLTLAWMVIGYFSLFDLGLGRALTKVVAEKLGGGKEYELPSLVYTALFLMLGLGVIGALVLEVLSSWLVYDVLKMPEQLQVEAFHAFLILAAAVPLVVTTTGLRGVLAANQRFGLVNAIRIPMGVFTFVGPLLVLPYSRSLFLITAALMAGRILAWVAYLISCLHVMPALRHGVVFKREEVAPLLRFGGWMTVSNIVSPLMVYFDRFIIGALISIAAVAYYATPYEIATKLLLIPAALIGVLFPAFSTSFIHDRKRAALLFEHGLKYVFIVLFPITLITVTLAYEGIDLWLGAEFAQNSARILQWLSIGVFINSFAQISFVLVQGAGRPDLTAKLHLLQLPFYLVAVLWAIGAYGIEGAAIVWVARVIVDTVFLFAMCRRVLTKSSTVNLRDTLSTLAASLLILAIASLFMGIEVKLLFITATLIVFAMATWYLLLQPEERMYLLNLLRIKIACTERK